MDATVDDCYMASLDSATVFGRREREEPLCLPMPPDHEYEIPLGNIGDRTQMNGLRTSTTYQNQAFDSDPFFRYGLSSEDDSNMNMNDLFPPSLQELLESAYSKIYEETLLEEQEVPFDQHVLNILDSNEGDFQEQLGTLDVLGEVEMTSSPASPCGGGKVPSTFTSSDDLLVGIMETPQLGSSSAGGTEVEETASTTDAEGVKSQFSARGRGRESNPTEKKRAKRHHVGPLQDTFIENKCNRKRRFLYGLQTLITKVCLYISFIPVHYTLHLDFGTLE
jgi:hypothetical protein